MASVYEKLQYGISHYIQYITNYPINDHHSLKQTPFMSFTVKISQLINFIIRFYIGHEFVLGLMKLYLITCDNDYKYFCRKKL